MCGALCAGCPLLVSEPLSTQSTLSLSPGHSQSTLSLSPVPPVPEASSSPCRSPRCEAEEEQPHPGATCTRVNPSEISQAANISGEERHSRTSASSLTPVQLQQGCPQGMGAVWGSRSAFETPQFICPDLMAGFRSVLHYFSVSWNHRMS